MLEIISSACKREIQFCHDLTVDCLFAKNCLKRIPTLKFCCWSQWLFPSYWRWVELAELSSRLTDWLTDPSVGRENGKPDRDRCSLPKVFRSRNCLIIWRRCDVNSRRWRNVKRYGEPSTTLTLWAFYICAFSARPEAGVICIPNLHDISFPLLRRKEEEERRREKSYGGQVFQGNFTLQPLGQPTSLFLSLSLPRWVRYIPYSSSWLKFL